MDRLTIRSAAEARVRAVTADRLGVNEDQLSPALSLVDELAVDSLDIADLAVALEDDLAITLPDTVLDTVRTYADLVAVVLAALERQRARRRDMEPPPVRIVARLARANVGGAPLERSGELTPYLAQTIVEDALRLGAGSRIDVTVTAPADAAAVIRVRERLAPLAAQRIELRVQHEPLSARRRDISAA